MSRSQCTEAVTCLFFFGDGFGERVSDPIWTQMNEMSRNRCRCKRCGDVIESVHMHDLVRCRCCAIFVDGGTLHRRRGGVSIEEVPDDGGGKD